jgi:hypothetical protein
MAVLVAAPDVFEREPSHSRRPAEAPLRVVHEPVHLEGQPSREVEHRVQVVHEALRDRLPAVEEVVDELPPDIVPLPPTFLKRYSAPTSFWPAALCWVARSDASYR